MKHLQVPSFLMLTCCFLLSIFSNAQDAHEVNWSIHIDGFNDAEVTACAVDKDGNSYYTLQYTADLDIQGLKKKFPYSPYVSAALLKVSPAGNPEWAHSVMSTKDCRLTAVEVGPSGNVYITGHGDGVVRFESNSKKGESGKLVNKNNYAEPSGIVVACYNPKGELLWNKKFGSSWASGLGVACNSKEDIYIPFHHNYDLMDENGKVISPFIRASIHDSKQGVLKLNKKGEVIGVIELSYIRTSSYIHRFGGKFDNADHYILHGTMYGSYQFGNQDSIHSDISKSSLDSYVAKFDPDSNLEWYQHIGGRNNQWIRDIDIDKSNNIIALVSYDKECFVSKGIAVNINTELYGKYGTDFTFFKLFPNGEMDYRYTYVHHRNAYNILPMYIDLAANDMIVMTGSYNDTLQIEDKSIYAGYHNPLPMRMHWDKTEIKYLAKMGNSDYFFTPTAQDVNGKNFCGAAHYAGKKNELINKSSKIKLNNRDHGRAAVIYGATLKIEEKEPEVLAQQENREKENVETIKPLMSCLSTEDLHSWLPIAASDTAAIQLNEVDTTATALALSLEEPCYTKTLEIEASVFPNPTRGAFTVNVGGLSGENLEIEIYSEGGQLIFTHRDKSPDSDFILEMNSSTLAAGVYYIRIIAATHQKVLKLVVTK